MIIRNGQLREFEADAQRRFEDRAMAKLRAGYPKLLEGTSETLRGTVQNGSDRTVEFGLLDEAWVLEFLGYVVQFGDGFAATPHTDWARRILERPDLKAEEKITELDAYFPRHLI